MSNWKIKSLDSFPAGWRDLLLDSPKDDKVLGTKFTEKSIRALQEQWQFFRYCVREIGGGELLEAERKFAHRARIEWLETVNCYALILNSRAREGLDEALKNFVNPD